MQARILAQQQERQQKLVFYAITMSLLLHIAFFTVFVVLPEFSGRERVATPIYVSIVGGGGGGPGPMPMINDVPAIPADAGNFEATREIQPATTKPDAAPDPVYVPPPVETAVVTPSDYGTVTPDEQDQPQDVPEVEVKTIVTRTVKPQNATQQVEQIQRNLQQTQQQTQQATQRADDAVSETQTGNESVASAIQQLRDKQAAGNAGAAVSGGGGTGTGIGTGSGSGSGGGGQGHGGFGGPLNVYLGIIVPIIERNWSFSPSMFKGNANMEVIIQVDILASGEVTNIDFTKKSGDAYLDESAYRALAKSNPLPAYMDSGIRETRITLQFRFTPKGLQMR